MAQTIINNRHQNHASKKLKKFYNKGLIAPDKKEYLTNHRKSSGAWLAMEDSSADSGYMLDAASQIATLGLGFNPSVFFGTTQWQETWTGNARTKQFKQLDKAFTRLLATKLGCDEVGVRYCHSGAEANEIALGKAFISRKNAERTQVLAFEGSFHGRMLISLCSTWNKAKREPFQIPGYETVFTPFPEDKSAVVCGRDKPEGWLEYWSKPEGDCPKFSTSDDNKLLATEIDCLKQVHEQLKENKIFAAMVEPMQCEGGDRFGTDRFFQALRVLTLYHDVPLIIDEVQTGFHLGREFFWHRELDFQNQYGQTLYPDYVVCAKKAQVGIVLAPNNKDIFNDDAHEFNTTSVIRGYIHGVSLDQHQENIWQLEVMMRAFLEPFCEKFAEYIEYPRAQGMSFAFDFKDASYVQEWIKRRFKFGLLFYQAGATTLRFRLNLNYSVEDIEFLFQSMDSIAEEAFLGKEIDAPVSFIQTKKNAERNYKLSELFLKIKRAKQNSKKQDLKKDLEKLNKIFLGTKVKNYTWKEFNDKNIEKFSSAVEDIQRAVYEPARQTATTQFFKIARDANGIGMGLFDKKKLIGICFAAPLELMKTERGVADDPDLANEKVLYMQDVTVLPDYSGKGLGKLLKTALMVKAMHEGVEAIRGRNRDRYAATMFDINLSLGAFELKNMKDDYPDAKPFRNSIYYSMATKWEENETYLTDRLENLGIGEFVDKKGKEALEFIVNKVCLSNFVNTDYLERLDFFAKQLPKDLRHCYASSGQSECVDKLIKSAWQLRKPYSKLLTFKDHFFGTGSFMSRSLSQDGEAFFPTECLPHPTAENSTDVLAKVEEQLKTGVMAIFIEPLPQKLLQKVPKTFLKKLKSLTTKYKTPLIYNETASSSFAFHEKGYYAACDSDILPDMGMQYLGGQMGIVYSNKKYFIDKPLWMISTWDGDEFSLWKHKVEVEQWSKNKAAREKLLVKFTQKLTQVLHDHKIKDFSLDRGTGIIREDLPAELSKYFESQNGNYLVNPTFSSMAKFLKES